jgi:hypothetical protein
VAKGSALVLAKSTEHFRRAFGSHREHERFGQFVEISRRWFDVTQGTQTIERGTFRRRRKNRHSTPPIRDLDRFALFDATEEFTGPLPEFPDAD